jgi:hypothetical protein
MSTPVHGRRALAAPIFHALEHPRVLDGMGRVYRQGVARSLGTAASVRVLPECFFELAPAHARGNRSERSILNRRFARRKMFWISTADCIAQQGELAGEPILINQAATGAIPGDSGDPRARTKAQKRRVHRERGRSEVRLPCRLASRCVERSPARTCHRWSRYTSVQQIDEARWLVPISVQSAKFPSRLMLDRTGSGRTVPLSVPLWSSDVTRSSEGS